MDHISDHVRTIEEEKADEFSEIVRREVRGVEGFSAADGAARDAMFMGVAQKFMAEDGGFLEADDEGQETTNSGEMLPALLAA